MDQTLKTCLLVALQRNPVESGKGIAMAMTNVWTLLNVEHPIVMSHPIHHIAAVLKNLTAAIQVHMSMQIKTIRCCNSFINIILLS